MQEQISRLIRQWNLEYWQWDLIVIGSAVLIGFGVHWVLSFLVRKKAREIPKYSFFRSLIKHLAFPFSYFLPVVMIAFALPLLRMEPGYIHPIRQVIEISLIILFAWILINSIKVVQDYVIYRYDISKTDNLKERRIRTQLMFMRHIAVSLIIILAIAAVLLTFSTMRKIGTGLLTGVGIGGIIIGFAAQRSLGNLLAGIQIAITQPIRIDDAVLVEGEFGIIEEIRLTYVVVKVWDERRLILPIHYFIEKPFQNWTRTSAKLMGTVLFYVDYTTPIEPIRQHLEKLLEKSKYWDKRARALQVTNTTERTLELRALMSAQTSGDLWELRCYIREEMILFIREHFPESLPRTRTTIEGEGGPTNAEALLSPPILPVQGPHA